MPTVNGYVTGEPIAASDINAFFLRGSRNALINGDMRIGQRGTALTNVADAAYSLDRWVFLGDGTLADINLSTTSPTGGLNSMQVIPKTAAKKFGVLQIIENKNIVGLRGSTVSLSFKMNVNSSTINNIKAAVISWAGTADSVTRDVISSWNASGTTPTLVANWSFCNTPTNVFTVGSSWVDVKLNALPNQATINNLAVLIWCDTTSVTNGDSIYLTDVQLEAGSVATPYERKSTAEELANCQRYYEDSVNALMVAGSYAAGLGGNTYATAVFFKVTKRITPTSVNGGSDTVGNLRFWDNTGVAGRVSSYRGAWSTTTNVSCEWIGTWGFNVLTTGGTTDAAMLAFRYAVSTEL